jgi:hypothetical protein
MHPYRPTRFMGLLGPANDTKLGVHILPLAFPWTLAMIRKVATILGPAALSHLISERCWCMNKLRAASGKRQAASCKKRFDIYRIFLYKVNAPVFMYPASLNSNMMDQVQRHTPHCAAVFAGCWI